MVKNRGPASGLQRRDVLKTVAGALSVAGIGVGSASAANHTGGETVTIIHDTHFHGRFEDAGDSELNIARYYTEIERLTEEHENAVFLGNGDDIAPSLLGLEYEGEHMIEALNYIEPDAIGAGNHEFDFGIDVATERFEESEFPWVIANLRTPEGEPVPGTERWTTIDAGEHTIGVFGLGVAGFHRITDYPEDWEVIPPIDAAEEATEALKDEGADLVVLASHVSSGLHFSIAEQVDGLDAIVGSHSGVVFSEPEIKSGTIISEFGDEFDHLGYVTIDVTSGELVDWQRLDFYNGEEADESPEESENITPIDMTEIEGDEELAAIMDEWIAELEGRLGRPYFTSDVALDATFDNYAVETAWGNLMTDMMRKVGDEPTDVAINNAGGIRSDSVYGPGEITGLNVMDILPFPNEIEVVEITGEDLRNYLEDVTRPLSDGSTFGAQPAIQVSGIQYEWRAHHGEAEILNLFVDGEPVEDEETYRVVSNDFVIGNNPETLGAGELVLQSGQFQGPFVLDRLEEEGAVSPQREHRIIRVDEIVEQTGMNEHDDELHLEFASHDAIVELVEVTFRAVSRTHDSVEAKAVEETTDGFEVHFETDGVQALIEDTDEPALRLFGGFAPDESYYGYEDGDDLLSLPVSSGYDHFKLKADIDAASLVDEAAEESTTDDSDETDAAADDEGTAPESDDDTDTEPTDDGMPGFGPLAAVGSIGAGAYGVKKLADREADDE